MMATFSEQMAVMIRGLDERLAALEALEMGVSGGVTPAPTGQGSILISNATPAWTELVHPGAAYQHLETDAVTAGWSQILNLGTAAGGGGEYLSLRDDVNAVTAAEFVNADGGAAAAMLLLMKNVPGAGGTNALGVGVTGTGFTTAGIVLQNAGLIQGGTDLQALTIRMIGDKPIIFGVAGTTEVLRLSSAEVLASLDVDFVSGKGITHADGVTAGWVLRADGTRYVPSALQVGDLPLHAAEHEVGGGDLVGHDSLIGFVGNEHIDHTGVTLTAGNGLTGGGDISASRTFTMGTPGTLTAATANGVTAASHTHAITDTSDGETNPSTILSADVNGRLRLAGLSLRAAFGTAAALYVPWITGDGVTTSYFGSTNISNNQSAIYADTYSGHAIRGNTVSGIGLYGYANGVGRGVYGLSTGGVGIYGASGTDIGVYGQSSTGVAGHFNLTGGGAAILQCDDNGTPVFTIGDGPFATVADNFWMGLGAAAGRIEWDNQATDEINFLNCNVGVGTSAPISILDSAPAANLFALTIGADVAAQTRTDATRKLARFGMPHYTNAEEPFTLIVGDADAANNIINIGGGTGVGNAATLARIYTAANTTTVTGTERVRVNSSGNMGIAVTSPLGKLHVDQASTTAAIPVLVLDQADLSEEFIDFRTTVGAGNPIDTAAIGTYYGKARVAVNGTFKYVALYNS